MFNPLQPAWFLKLAAPVFCNHASGLSVQPIGSVIFCAKSKEGGLHYSYPESIMPPAAVRFSTYIDYSYSLKTDGTRSRSLFPMYPTFLKPPHNLSFSDQYAFSPTGSTTAAIICLLQTVTSLLQSNPYVEVISLDFSKAFDTVRHATLLTKVAELDLPVSVYN
jgi:hypothetical protein